MNRITKIKENEHVGKVNKIRVAAYCRVSTASDEQLISLEMQKAHYETYIKANTEWEFTGLYYDEGISGTKTAKREGLLSMLKDCERGLIDYIITKSISRFARNTTDCLTMVQRLLELDIPVFFEKENINTMDSKGDVQVNHNRFLGYTKDENGHLIIDPVEAEVVKRIYYEYLEGASLAQIGQGLQSDGILTAAGKAKWRPETLKKILKNEKYIGDALLQKAYTVDFLTKKRVKNNGIVPQYYVENSHEAIIPRDLYMQVQEEMVRRSNLHSGAIRKKRVYSSKYALSSIVYCPKCGDIYRRIAWNNRGRHSIVWRCVSRVEHGPQCCDAPTVQETELQAAVMQAINTAYHSRDAVLEQLQQNIDAVLSEAGQPTDDVHGRLEELQKELLKLANSKADYTEVADEIDRLREMKQNALVEVAERDGYKQRIAEMMEYLKEQNGDIENFDETLVRKMIEKVMVYEDKFTVEFKAGISLDIERQIRKETVNSL